MRQPPVSKAEAATHQEAVRVTEAIRAELTRVTGAFFQIGELLRQVQDKKLYVGLGHMSMRAYIEGELSVAATQAYLMIRVVRSFVRADAERVGLERAASLIRYAKAVGDVDPGELVRADAHIGDRTVSTASVRDIDRARKVLEETRRRKRRAGPAEREHERVSRAIAGRLHALHREQGLGRAHIEVTGDAVVVRFARAALVKRLGL